MILKRACIVTSLIIIISTIVTGIWLNTKVEAGNTIMSSQKSSDENAEISIDYKEKKIEVKSKQDVIAIEVNYNNQRERINGKEAIINVNNGSYHEIGITFYKENESMPCYEKNFSFVTEQNITRLEKMKIEKIQEDLEGEYPLIKEKLSEILISDTTEIKIFKNINGQWESCLLVSDDDCNLKNVKELSQELLLKMAFPDISTKKINQIKNILSD